MTGQHLVFHSAPRGPPPTPSPGGGSGGGVGGPPRAPPPPRRPGGGGGGGGGRGPPPPGSSQPFFARQHFLYFLPEPQGHGSFRPTFWPPPAPSGRRSAAGPRGGGEC